MCFLTEIIVCVAYLRQKSKVNFRSTKVDAGNLKRKYLNRRWQTLAVNVLIPFLLKFTDNCKTGEKNYSENEINSEGRTDEEINRRLQNSSEFLKYTRNIMEHKGPKTILS